MFSYSFLPIFPSLCSPLSSSVWSALPLTTHCVTYHTAYFCLSCSTWIKRAICGYPLRIMIMECLSNVLLFFPAYLFFPLSRWTLLCDPHFHSPHTAWHTTLHTSVCLCSTWIKRAICGYPLRIMIMECLSTVLLFFPAYLFFPLFPTELFCVIRTSTHHTLRDIPHCIRLFVYVAHELNVLFVDILSG